MASSTDKGNPLTDLAIKNAQPKEKTYTLRDGDWLFLEVRPDGDKVWIVRCKRIIDGKEKQFNTTKGKWYSPDELKKNKKLKHTSLSDARKLRDEYKASMLAGVNPADAKRQAKQKEVIDSEGQLHEVIKKYLARLKGTIADNTLRNYHRQFERDILPFFATYKPNSTQAIDNIETSKHIGSIKHSEILKAILAIEARGAEHTAHRVYEKCNGLWLFAVQHGYAKNNIVANIDKRYALKKPNKGHFASTVDPSELKRYFDFTDKFNRSYAGRYALRLLPYIFLRAGNITTLEWSEVDFEKKLIIIKAEKMKKESNGDFVLPITDKAIEILNEIKPFSGHLKYVFPSAKNPSKHISDNTLSKALRENGFKGILTPHGFRATFTSIARSHKRQHELDNDAIEACLHHAIDSGKTSAHYAYMADYLQDMTMLMQWWSSFLDGLRGDEVLK